MQPGTTMDHHGKVNEDREIIVSGIPIEPLLELLEDKVQVEFQTQRSGGGDVDSVQILDRPTVRAKIKFHDPKVARRILAKQQFSFLKTHVTVTSCHTHSLPDSTVFHEVKASLLFQKIPFPEEQTKILVGQVLQGTDVKLTDNSAHITADLTSLKELNKKLISEVQKLEMTEAETTPHDYRDLLEVIATLKLDKLSLSAEEAMKAAQDNNLEKVEKRNENTLRIKGTLQDVIKVNQNLISLMQIQGNTDDPMATKYYNQNAGGGKVESDQAKRHRCRLCGCESLSQVVGGDLPSSSRDKSDEDDEVSACSDEDQSADKILESTFEIVDSSGQGELGVKRSVSDDKFAATETSEGKNETANGKYDSNEERQKANTSHQKDVTVQHENNKHGNDNDTTKTEPKTHVPVLEKIKALPSPSNSREKIHDTLHIENSISTLASTDPSETPVSVKERRGKKDEGNDSGNNKNESLMVHEKGVLPASGVTNNSETYLTDGSAEGRESRVQQSPTEHGSKLVIKDEVEILLYLLIVRSDEKNKIEKQYMVSIEPKDNTSICIEPNKGCSAEDVRLAKEELQELIKSIKSNLKCCIIDITGAEINSDGIQEATKIINQYEREHKILNIKPAKEQGIQFVGEDEESLIAVLDIYCKKVGANPSKQRLFRWSTRAPYRETESDTGQSVTPSKLAEQKPTNRSQPGCTEKQNNKIYDKQAEKSQSGKTGPLFEIPAEPRIDASKEAKIKSSGQQKALIANLETPQGERSFDTVKGKQEKTPGRTAEGTEDTNGARKKTRDEKGQVPTIQNLSDGKETKTVSQIERQAENQSANMNEGESNEFSETKAVSSVIEASNIKSKAAHVQNQDSESKKVSTRKLGDSQTGCEVPDPSDEYQTDATANSRDVKQTIRESYDSLFYIFQMYRDEIKDIMKVHEVHIKWSPADDRETVHLIPNDNCTKELLTQATEKMVTLIECGTESLQKQTIDLSNVASLKRENVKEAEKVLKIFEKAVAYYIMPKRQYILLSENEEKLDKAIHLFNKAIKKSPKNLESQSATIPKSLESQLEAVQSHPLDQESESPDVADYLSKKATVGENMLAYIFHVYKDQIIKMERKRSVKFVWKEGDDVTIKAVEGPGKCSQQDLESVYENFVTFVQKNHSKIIVKDINLSEKDIHTSSISQAIKDIQAQHSCILFREIKSKHIRIMGEEGEVKVAMETFCNYLGVNTQPSRHGGKKKQEPFPGVQRSNSYPNNNETVQTGKVLVAFEFGTVDKRKVSVCLGDITRVKVDIICNAANEWLSHAGGVAEAIVKAGGYSIQKESDKILKDRDSQALYLSEVVYTKPGRLPCQWILHTVGPRWSDHSESVARQALHNCCTNLLSMAEELKAKSIAIPAIGTGIYGVPTDICAEMMSNAVIQYFNRQSGGGTLQEILFIDVNRNTVDAFTSTVSRVFGGSVSSNLQNPGKEGSSVDPSPYHSSHTASVHGDIVSRQPTGRDQGTRMLFTTVVKGTNSNVHSSTTDPGAVPKSTKQTRDSPDHSDSDRESNCAICLDKMKNPRTLPCKHKFCKSCMDRSEKAQGRSCPVCKDVYGKITGNMPKGTMKERVKWYPDLPGYPGCGRIEITYDFPNGKQGKEHPNPGKWYTGTTRTAYLPNNAEGQEVLRLLKIAFDRRLTFTIGTSRTTGATDTVTWNDIHHKTNTYGGAAGYGYPDPDYLRRVKEELAAKGVK